MKKKVIVNKSRSLAAIFVSKYGMKHFKRIKIHPMNTLETHLRHFEQAFWYLPRSVKSRFTKRPLAAILIYQSGPKSIGFLL